MIEQLNQLVHDSRLTSHHVSLYVALWLKNLQEGPNLVIERNSLMQQSKIHARSTYTRCLYQLQEWGYLYYKPAPNQFQTSEVRLAMQKSEHSSSGAMPTNESSNELAMPKSLHSKASAMQISEPSNSSAMPKNEYSNFGAMPKNEHSDTIQTTNSQIDNFAIPKSEPSKIFPPPPPSSSYKRDKNNLLLKKNDVDDVVGRPKSKRLASDHLFSQSPYFDWPTFEAALAEANRKQNIDLKYYHDALMDWRDRESGLPPLRSDWIRMARVFMRNDAKHGKLVLNQNMTFTTQVPVPQPKNPRIINNEKYRPT
jgi:hypothetical protein